jgi:3',5'-cyclic AMP phosphodiesterase CpdA
MNVQAPNKTGAAHAARIVLAIVQAAAVITLASGCLNGFFADLNTRDDLGARPDVTRATGIAQDFVRFAQFTDVHIVDDANPLRFENLPMGSSTRADLDPYMQSISREQDRYSARIWDAVVRSINAKNAMDTIDFALFTGDATDTGIKTELRWFIEIADGIKSASLQSAIDAGTMQDVTPAGLDIPWYAAVGNHDVEYQGTLNGLIMTRALLSSAGDTGDLCRLPDAVDLYADSLTDPLWHGFDNQPAIALDHSYGYYSFNPSDLVHCIVLDTAIYNPGVGFSVDTLAGGTLDRVQYDWMVSDIKANANRVCIIISHHSALGSFDDRHSQISSAKLRKTLCSYENVIAHVNGHSHVNRISAVMYNGLPGGYWNINTSSVIEWPQEWRDITVRDNGDGTGTITCLMVQHTDTVSLDVAESDPDAQKTAREGEAQDRNVELTFRIPLAVKDYILGP